MKEFGAALRIARERAGLSIKDLYDRTRINPKHLEALETGNIPGLPQTYVRAFLRDYAREVGLDEEQVLARYNELAEQAKGIAPPPPPPDTSALIPKLDDTIEIVAPLEEGEPERHPDAEPVPPPPAKDERQLEFFPPRRIELDMTPEENREPESPAPEKPDLDISGGTSAPEETIPPLSPEGTTPAAPAEPPKVEQRAEPVAGSEEIDEESHAGFLNLLMSSDAAEAEKRRARGRQGKPTRVYDTRPIPPSDPEYSAASKSRDTEEKKAPPPKKPVSRAGTPDSQRRARIAAWLIIVIICVTLYAVVEFGGKKEEAPLSKVDSAQVAAQMRAKSFVDSSQFVIPQEIAAPQETSTQKNPKEEVAMEPVKQVFAAEDSLVLEAFSSSSVWFAIRMDTTRSERGSLSANDHRVWKAKDRFVVTLGDAGAVTFVLNGSDLGSLGDAGSVAKNVTISRGMLRK